MAEVPEKKQRASIVATGPLPSVGDRVSSLIAKEGPREVGTVRFVGTTEFAEGDWIGVELDEAKGKNNGSVRDKSYFECKDGYGIFVRQNMLQPHDPEKRSSVVKTKARTGKRSSLVSKNSIVGSPGMKSPGSTTTPSSPTSPGPGSPTSPSSADGKRLKGKAAGADFEAQKRQYQELEAVRAAVRSLAQTVHSVQEKAASLEKSVVAKEATVDSSVLAAAKAAVAAGDRGASLSEKAFVEKWLQGVGDKMRDQMSQELKKRTESAIASAVEQGTKQLTEAAQPLKTSEAEKPAP